MILSVDGGATKTIAILVDENSYQVRGIGLAGPSNLRSVSVEVATENIRSAMNKAIGDNPVSSITQSIFGIAGFGDSTLNTKRVTGIIENVAHDFPHVISNDGEIASFLITTGREGCIVAPGTGSVGSYIIKGKAGRVGGWSYLTSDQGSGFWIARKALEMAEKSYDGLIQYTLLVKEFEKHFQMDLRDIVADLEENFDKRRIASLSTLVNSLADQGDIVARKVLEMAVEEISLMIDGMAGKFDTPHITGCAGGVIRSSIVRELLRKRYGNIPMFFGYHIVAGGVMKLLNLSGSTDSLMDVRENIIEGINEALEHYNREEKREFLFL